MTKKRVLLVILVVTFLFLSGCMPILKGGRTDSLTGGTEKREKARMEEIVKAVKENDREAIKTCFQKQL